MPPVEPPTKNIEFAKAEPILTEYETALKVVLNDNEVAVRILAAPINPSDINMVSSLSLSSFSPVK